MQAGLRNLPGHHRPQFVLSVKSGCLYSRAARAQSPAGEIDALISLAWLGAAQGRAPTDRGGKVQAGIDVAEAGEAETVLVVREGPALLKLKAWTGIDARGAVAAELAPFRRRLETVNVDTIGALRSTQAAAVKNRSVAEDQLARRAVRKSEPRDRLARSLGHPAQRKQVALLVEAFQGSKKAMFAISRMTREPKKILA